jgi:hypothetical protein
MGLRLEFGPAVARLYPFMTGTHFLRCASKFNVLRHSQLARATRTSDSHITQGVGFHTLILSPNIGSMSPKLFALIVRSVDVSFDFERVDR